MKVNFIYRDEEESEKHPILGAFRGLGLYSE